MTFLQEPDFQENEFMYDDFDLEENIASCECFVTVVSSNVKLTTDLCCFLSAFRFILALQFVFTRYYGVVGVKISTFITLKQI